MTPTQRKAAERLIAAFDNERISLPAWESVCRQGFALLRGLLAEPMQDLTGDVAWLWTHCRALGMTEKSLSGTMRDDVALYVIRLQEAAKPPQQRRPLTREQIDAVWSSLGSFTDRESDYRIFARAIERAHGIGEPT